MESESWERIKISRQELKEALEDAPSISGVPLEEVAFIMLMTQSIINNDQKQFKKTVSALEYLIWDKVPVPEGIVLPDSSESDEK